MIHIFQQLKVVSENFCLFWDLVKIYLESQDIKADSFLLSQFPPNPSDSFHFSILPNHRLWPFFRCVIVFILGYHFHQTFFAA